MAGGPRPLAGARSGTLGVDAGEGRDQTGVGVARRAAATSGAQATRQIRRPGGRVRVPGVAEIEVEVEGGLDRVGGGAGGRDHGRLQGSGGGGFGGRRTISGRAISGRTISGRTISGATSAGAIAAWSDPRPGAVGAIRVGGRNGRPAPSGVGLAAGRAAEGADLGGGTLQAVQQGPDVPLERLGSGVLGTGATDAAAAGAADALAPAGGARPEGPGDLGQAQAIGRQVGEEIEIEIGVVTGIEVVGGGGRVTGRAPRSGAGHRIEGGTLPVGPDQGPAPDLGTAGADQGDGGSGGRSTQVTADQGFVAIVADDAGFGSGVAAPEGVLERPEGTAVIGGGIGDVDRSHGFPLVARGGEDSVDPRPCRSHAAGVRWSCRERAVPVESAPGERAGPVSGDVLGRFGGPTATQCAQLGHAGWPGRLSEGAGTVEPMPLTPFSPPVRAWFSTTFPEPTAAQAQGWPAIAAGEHTLILAPTGSGKTLAAFLWGLDRLSATPPPDDKNRRTRLLYISPLRALAVDVEKNLRAPLQGIELAAERLGEPFHAPSVGMRTGDTPADERRALVRNPPDLLITTPESLYLMLTSAARETLAGVEAVIIDEIHALAATKRGAHLALTLERLDALVASRQPADAATGHDTTAAPRVQRIGLSATQRPLDEIARFLGGHGTLADGGRGPRPVQIVDAGVRKPLEIEVIVPVEDMGALGETLDEPTGPDAGSAATRRSIWPAMHPRLLELVLEHRSTLIFVNARRLSERLATRLNELHVDGLSRAAESTGTPPEPGFELVKAHHGSLSRERRLQIEDDLKSGRLRGLVATSSLELGIDMGAVDLVIQVESPGAVSRGLQRIGRAGHQVGAPSRGKVFPKHRNDLVETAVVVQRMHEGLIEHTRYPRNPLDVLAQQIVATVALDDWPVADLATMVRGAANFADLSDDVLHNVLDLLAGRYPSDEFSELRPRVVWDRVDNVIRGRAGAQRLAVTSGGTIPDRGLFGVFLPDGTRVGELDEEMVYESRPGETFLLGASTWRITDITHERVVVVPAPGEPGKMPFWRGDGPGRPLELGRALGAFVREIRALPEAEAIERLRRDNDLDERAAVNLVQYLQEQAAATAGAVPDDRTIVVERFRDEIGDWRICILTPFGAQVHAPWAMALQHRLTTEHGMDVDLMWSDDGIVLRLPDATDEFPMDDLLLDPDEVADIVVAQLPNTAMFASRFRECAARALLLPRRRPDRRTPLWQQRQRAADLLTVAARHPDFPILLEATRECLNDVFDLPALREVLTDLRARKIRIVPVDTPRASPFAQSLLFGWIAVYMYEGDAPLAERRAAALSLDRDLLRDLLGAEELRELIDPLVLGDLELELQRLVDGRRARDPDELHDLLRTIGPFSQWELDSRAELADSGGTCEPWVDQLVAERRAFRCTVAGEPRVAASEDAARLRDALGVALPAGLPAVFTDPVPRPWDDLVARFARSHGPFVTTQVAARYGVGVERVLPVLESAEAAGRLVRGEFRPDGIEREWCDDDVLRQLRRRSLAALRREVEPVEASAFARFLPEWQGVGAPNRGVDALVEVIGFLQGAAIPASVLETDVLPARLSSYRPVDLDELCATGEVVWVGAGPVGSRDGRVRLLFRDQAGLLVAPAGAPALPGDGSDSSADGAEATGARGAAVGAADAVAALAAPAPDAPTTSPTVEGGIDAVGAAVAAVVGDPDAWVIPKPILGAGGAELPAPLPRSRKAPADDASTAPSDPIHHALRAQLARGGASFWPDLVAAAQQAGVDYDDATVLDGLWDLVWAGEVTNDSLAPLRAMVSGAGSKAKRSGARATRAATIRARRPNLGRPKMGSLNRLGPPAAAGRWSLVAPLLSPRPVPTEAVHAQAMQLLERHGVLTREAALAEGIGGGFAGIYPVLKALEDRGHVRRGYFVAGLGAAQFALPGAVDRLRAARDVGEPDLTPVVLAATDPAQPYGAAMPWPDSAGRPARSAGAYLVLVAGEPVAYLERGAHSLATFAATEHHPHWAEGLVALVKDGRLRKIDLTKIDGASPSESPVVDHLRSVGFADGYKGLTLRS